MLHTWTRLLHFVLLAESGSNSAAFRLKDWGSAALRTERHAKWQKGFCLNDAQAQIQPEMRQLMSRRNFCALGSSNVNRCVVGPFISFPGFTVCPWQYDAAVFLWLLFERLQRSASIFIYMTCNVLFHIWYTHMMLYIWQLLPPGCDLQLLVADPMLYGFRWHALVSPDDLGKTKKV